MKIAVPDFITNSYFPAVAAVESTGFKEEGIDMELEHIFPLVNKALRSHARRRHRFRPLRSGTRAARRLQNWEGAKILGALAQGMY